MNIIITVSYTHLDVYKRQDDSCESIEDDENKMRTVVL